MSSGLAWLEDYVDAQQSDVIEMLFGRGKDDVAGVRGAGRRSRTRPTPSGATRAARATWSPRSRAARSAAASPTAASFLRRELFERIGMASASARFDAGGHLDRLVVRVRHARATSRASVCSYLRDGVWEGERVLPEGWVDYARTPTPGSSGEYGAHWWLPPGGEGMFSANGYRGPVRVRGARARRRRRAARRVDAPSSSRSSKPGSRELVAPLPARLSGLDARLGVAGARRRGRRACPLAASSASIHFVKSSSGRAPEIRIPLMKNAGVPVRPAVRAASASALTRASASRVWRDRP